MARVFREAGIPALAVSGETPDAQRADALARLRAGDVNCLFAADLFNEGLDLPEVDTILLLRPTQSATVFLQQLGRGLRRAHGKPVLTVLDLIGQHRKEFRFDVRYRALTGSSRTGARAPDRARIPVSALGIPARPRPSGSADCAGQRPTSASLVEEAACGRRPVARRLVSESIPGGVRSRPRRRVQVQRLMDGTTQSCRLPDDASGPDESSLLRRVSTLAHVDDPERAQAYSMLVASDAPAL